MNGFIREIKKEGSLWCSLMFLQAKFKHYNRKTYRWRRGKMLNLLLCSNGITALKILQCLLKRNEKLARYFEICGWGDPLAPIIELIPPLPQKKTAICKVVMIRNLQRCPRNNCCWKYECCSNFDELIKLNEPFLCNVWGKEKCWKFMYFFRIII